METNSGVVALSANRSEKEVSTYNNDPDVFNIFRSKELAKIIRGTLFM